MITDYVRVDYINLLEYVNIKPIEQLDFFKCQYNVSSPDRSDCSGKNGRLTMNKFVSLDPYIICMHVYTAIYYHEPLSALRIWSRSMNA